MDHDLSFQPRRNLRLVDFDYSRSGAYFVTIVTHHRKPLFGEIVNGEMILDVAGRMVTNVWTAIPSHYPNVELGEFVVMPNHIHGILVITTEVGATHASPADKNPNGPKSGSVGAIIGSFKSAATKRLHELPELSGEQVWQRNYYEHIIRDDRDFQTTYDYILANPMNWEKDEEFDNGSTFLTD